MIIGLTGKLCAGCDTLAKFLRDVYNFEIINMVELLNEEVLKLSPTKKKEKS